MKDAISQALRIIRDSVRDLWPLLRDDGAFYAPAAIAMVTIFYLADRIAQNSFYFPHGDKVPVLLAIMGLFLAFWALLLLWNGVAATRSIGEPSASRLTAIIRYCLINLRLGIYATIVGILVCIVAAVVFLAVIYPNGTTSVSRPHVDLFTSALFAAGLLVFNAKWGAAAAFRILSREKNPIRMSWSLTNRFWQQSFVLAGALALIGWVPYWSVPSSLAFAKYVFIALPYSFIVNTISARAYIQFAHEMLDATPTALQTH